MSITKAEMQEVLREFARDLRPAGNFGGGAPSGGTGAVGGAASSAANTGINLLGTAAGEAAGAVRRLATNSFSAADAIGTIGKTLEAAGVPFSSSITSIAQQVNGANESIKVLGNSGVDLAGDLGKFNKVVVDSGVDQEKFNRTLRDSGNAYSGVGLTMNGAAQNVLGFSRDLQTVPFIEQMKRAGTTQQEVAELAMISLKERRGIDLNDKKAREDMLENTVRLSGEMNEVARLTGVSRDEQMKKLAKDKENVVVQAELMGMDKDATSRYDLLKTTLGPLGETVSKLTDELFTGGIRTQEGANRMAALGPAGRQLEEAVLLQKNAVTAEQKTRAEAAMAEAKSAVARYQQSEAFLAQVKTDKSATGDAAREMMAQNAELKGRATAAATAGGVGLAPGAKPPSDAEIQQSRLDAAKRDTLRVTPDGKPIEGAAISTALNQVQERIFQEAKVASGELQKLNQIAGQQLLKLGAVQEKLDPRVMGADGRPVRREDTPTGTVIGSGANAARNALQDLQNYSNSVPAVDPATRQRLGGRQPPTRADGGPVGPGEPYWVGEEGPELVTFEQEGEVIPTDKIAGLGQDANQQDPFADMNSMFSGMQERLQSQMPDFGEMFTSMTVDIPDIGSIFADKIPKPSDIESLVPNVNDMFSGKFPGMAELESLIPDMSSLFTTSLPKTEDIERAMPDFDVLTSELASISPVSAFENINPPTNDTVAENPTFNIDYDAFGAEIARSMTPPATQNAEEKERMMTRAQPEEVSGATLNDLKDQLVQLNTNILELIAHSATSAENTGMAVRATRDLNGNLFA